MLTQSELDQLAEELGLTENRATQLFKPLVQLLAEGKPVSMEQLASATGKPRDQVVRALAESPSTEFDEHGNIIGAGLTLNPTPYRFALNGHTLYTWCALDTLIFPALLGQTAYVSSPTPGTGFLVQVTVTPDQVEAVDPPTAVVSIVKRAADPDVRRAFCNYVHFFSSADVATSWLAQHPDAILLPVADAFALGRRVAARL